MAKTAVPASQFLGFTSPHYTQVPDELFDTLMVELSGAELKVLLYIIRRTFGFKRDSDTISLSQILGGLTSRDGRQLDRGVGISKRSLLAALRSLAERGVIMTKRRSSAERGNEPTSYRLNIRTGTPQKEQEELPSPLVQKLRQGGGVKTAPSPRGKNYTIQETERKTDPSNLRKAAPTVDSVATGVGLEAVPPPTTTAHTGTAPPPSRGGTPEAIKTTLGRLQRHLQPAEPEAREAVTAYITEFAAELGDRAPLKSSITRAVHLYQQSGRTLASFLDRLHQARATVRERTTTPTSTPITNRIALAASPPLFALHLSGSKTCFHTHKREREKGGEAHAASHKGITAGDPTAVQPGARGRPDLLREVLHARRGVHLVRHRGWHR